MQNLLWNIRAERESDWLLHLYTQKAFLPYLYAANRTNYSRWLPTYILDMIDLPPDIKKVYIDGQFTYREKLGSFNGLWKDMGIEKTVIRDSKSDSGIIGLTCKASPLLQWTMT